MRLIVPEGEQPVVYVSTKLGCSRLVESRAESYNAAFFNDSGITPRERELMRSRFVSATGCNICNTFRADGDLTGYSDEPISEDVYSHVLDKSWSGYTDRERLILDFTERYIFDFPDMAADDAFFGRLNELFANKEIADLCVLAAHWECSRRLAQLFLGADNICEIPVGDRPLTELAIELGFAQPSAAL
jgi:alkylhydroperoxidase family enzyme